MACILTGNQPGHKHETKLIKKGSFQETQCHTNWFIVRGQQLLQLERQWNLQHSFAKLQGNSITYRFGGSCTILRWIHNAILLNWARCRVPTNVQAVWSRIVHLDISCQPSHHWGKKSQHILLMFVYLCWVFVITSPELPLSNRIKYCPP